ncbi:hypothetical protein A2U01_0059646, partial [Trifolium medium]|nr:hypothetical protein [Trifolium medium]
CSTYSLSNFECAKVSFINVLDGETIDPANFFSDRSSNCFSNSYISGMDITDI